MSQSSQSYSPRLTCNHTRRVLLAIVLAASTLIDIILAASYQLSFLPLEPSLTSYLLRCIVQLPSVCHSESCANHVTKLAIILTASYLLSSLPVAACSSPSSSSSLCSSRRVHLVVLIALCSSHHAHRVVLNASCRICQLSFVSARSVVVAYIDVH